MYGNTGEYVWYGSCDLHDQQLCTECDRYTGADTDGDEDTESDAYVSDIRNTDIDTIYYTDGDAYADAYCDSYADADGHEHTDTDSYAEPDTSWVFDM